MKTTDELIQLLKSGEYDGADLMQAWCRMKDQQQDIEHLQAKYKAVCWELEAAQNEINTLDNDLIKEVTARDFWEEKATELAGEIGEFLSVDFGEHSSHNCPVQAAIDFVYWEKNKDD